MKANRLSILLVTAVCAFSGCTSNGSGKGGSKTSIPPTPSTDPRDVPYEEKYPDYDKHYAEYDFQEQTGDDLKAEMHKYFIQEHKTYIKYENLRFYENDGTDLIPGTEEKELFYTGKKVGQRDNNYDREHVWPCDLSNGLWQRSSKTSTIPNEHDIGIESGKFSYWGAGSDLFHLRPATGSVNSNRSNAKFYDFTKAEEYSLKKLNDGGPYTLLLDDSQSINKKVEVADEFKGDVARILMYVYVHYSNGIVNVYYSKDHEPVYSLEEAIDEVGHSPFVCGALSLTNILAYSTEEECAETLIRWNQIDPPSKVEMNRNNYIESIQGNRNPFIDYPQLVRNILYY